MDGRQSATAEDSNACGCDDGSAMTTAMRPLKRLMKGLDETPCHDAQVISGGIEEGRAVWERAYLRPAF